MDVSRETTVLCGINYMSTLWAVNDSHMLNRMQIVGETWRSIRKLMRQDGGTRTALRTRRRNQEFLNRPRSKHATGADIE